MSNFSEYVEKTSDGISSRKVAPFENRFYPKKFYVAQHDQEFMTLSLNIALLVFYF